MEIFWDLVWVNHPCWLYKTVCEYTWLWFLYVLKSIHCMYFMYVGRWQSFVFTTSVLAVCVCGFLNFTAASSTQPRCPSVFLSLSFSLTSLTSLQLFLPFRRMDFIMSSDHWAVWRCFTRCWSSTATSSGRTLVVVYMYMYTSKPVSVIVQLGVLATQKDTPLSYFLLLFIKIKF